MKKQYTILLTIFLLFAAPLAGGLIRGLPQGLFSYPPVIVNETSPLAFSWPIYLMFVLVFVVALGCYFWPENFGFRKKKSVARGDESRLGDDEDGVERSGAAEKKCRLPLRGYVGIVLLVVAWILSWGHFAWLGWSGDFMFFPQWLGYILLIDGLTYKRTGRSIYSQARGAFWLLFPLSGLLWWYFEYLNRFVLNWWYSGVEGFSAFHYILYSSLCFSTVLPALFETMSLVLSFSYTRDAFSNGPETRKHTEIFAFSFICVGVLSMFVTGLFPSVFFPLVWLGPLFMCGGALGLMKIKTPLRFTQQGNYVFLAALAVSGLLCGVLWELWNTYSTPQWHYSIPYVTRYKIFEMPIPGYAGYLPFGIVCWFGWLILVNLLPNKMETICAKLESYMEDQVVEKSIDVDE